MDYLSHNIGINLNRIRKSKGMSLDVVAEQTGVSKSMLAQIEKGHANPSIGVLGKIVSGLRLEFNDLLTTPPMDTYLVHINDMTPTKDVPGRYRVWTCFPIEDNRLLEIYRIEIEPGQEYFSGGHGEKTKEYISILKGTLTMKLDGKSYEIGRQDVFRFDSDKDHIYRNDSAETIEFMVTFVAG